MKQILSKSFESLIVFKYVILSFVLGILIGAFAFYKLYKVPPKVITNTEVIHDVKTTERVIRGKDGTVTKEIIKETKTENKVSNIAILPKYRLGLLGGYHFKNDKINYGIIIYKPITQQFEVGFYLKQEPEFGFTASWGF